MHSSRMRTTRSSSRPGGVSTRPPQPRDQAPPRGQNDRQVVNILPSPKLRLRAVKMANYRMLGESVRDGFDI